MGMKLTKLPWLGILSMLTIACSHKAPTLDEMPHLAKLRPANQYFRINPGEKNILRAEKGSLFTIAPDSFALPKHFRSGNLIEIHIIEATKSLEFAPLPVSLEFQNGGQSTLFESAGMFFVAAKYEGEDLSLKPGKKIRVKFRTDVSGDKFFVYNHDAEKGWQKHGHNHEVMLPPVLIAQQRATTPRYSDDESEAADTPVAEGRSGKRPRKRPAAPAAPAIAAPSMPLASFGNKAIRELYRVYEIDRLTWWNFDYPKPNLTCLKGTLTGMASEYAAVTVFSKSELGAYTLFEPKEFRISFYRKTRARLFAIDEKGNIARTATFDTPKANGHHKNFDMPCFDLGEIKMEKVPDAVANDAGKLRSYLQRGD